MATLTAQRAVTAYLGTLPPPVKAQVVPTELPRADRTQSSGYRWSRPVVAAAAFVVVFGSVPIIMATVSDPGYAVRGAATPVQGLTIFAVFFVASAAIERLLEPLASLLPDAENLNSQAHAKTVAAGQALIQNPDDADDPMREAADAISNASFSTYWRTVAFWTLATVIAMIASAVLRLYFLRAVGIASGPRYVEVLATGLIVGSGTKPLHDLVGLMEKASASKP